MRGCNGRESTEIQRLRDRLRALSMATSAFAEATTDYRGVSQR